MSLRSTSMRGAWQIAGALVCALGMANTQAAPVPGQGDWETTLQARDINGDSVVDAWYDTALNITWLANANAGAGDMSWASANAWAASLDVYGVTGWRLPVMNPSSSTQSELSHMYCVTLGNFGPCNPLTSTPPGTWGFTNTAHFTNLESEWYWTGTAAGPDTAWVWAGDAISAYHSAEPVDVGNRAWAVHSGDVPVVPEPSSYALMMAGLALLAGCAGFAQRRR